MGAVEASIDQALNPMSERVEDGHRSQVLAATLFAHEPAALPVHESAGFDGHGGPLAIRLSTISLG